MHTNDDDSSTLVAFPVPAWTLGGEGRGGEEGQVKARFPSERTAAETRKRKGRETRWPMRAYDASQIVLPPSV